MCLDKKHAEGGPTSNKNQWAAARNGHALLAEERTRAGMLTVRVNKGHGAHQICIKLANNPLSKSDMHTDAIRL